MQQSNSPRCSNAKTSLEPCTLHGRGPCPRIVLNGDVDPNQTFQRGRQGADRAFAPDAGTLVRRTSDARLK